MLRRRRERATEVRPEFENRVTRPHHLVPAAGSSKGAEAEAWCHIRAISGRQLFSVGAEVLAPSVLLSVA